MGDAIHPGTHPLSGVGLEVLYATPVPADHAAAKPPRDLAKELRERFWISAARDAGTGPTSWAAVQVTFESPIERAAVGRDRNDPGDGFRHVVRIGTEGTDSRSEWFEVTEVFEGVRAADVESFMRLANGGRGGPGFDPQRFLAGLDLGIPRRAAQQRAADKVLAAVERKTRQGVLSRPRDHGYGTLIVGLPCGSPPIRSTPSDRGTPSTTSRPGCSSACGRTRGSSAGAAAPSGASWSSGKAHWKAPGNGGPRQDWTSTRTRRTSGSAACPSARYGKYFVVL